MSIFGNVVLPDPGFGKVPLWRQLLRGVSQLCFQANEITALFLIAAVAVYSWKSALYLIIAVIVGTLVARLVGAVPDLLDLGLYGFNSGLIGLALGAFFAPAPILWAMVAVMAGIVSAVTVAASRWLPFPFLAAPFIVCFWILWPLSDSVGLTKVEFAPFAEATVSWLPSIFAALGSALFAGVVLSGVLFLVGLALSNWRHAIVAVVGVIAAHWIADQGQVPGEAINSGLIGFNAVLCSIAVYSLLGEDLRLTLFGAIGATLLLRVFNLLGLVPLAAGFVTMTWMLMLLAWFNPIFRGTTATATAQSVEGERA
jgi:urea transporter